jgi:uncharacterized membrane protein
VSTRFRLRQIRHDVGASLFLRPTLIAIVVAALSIILVEVDRWRFLVLPQSLIGEPSSAQAVFASIAGSVMAVVSIVYSVLVMSVTLASMQFSPRIVSALLRDPVSQNVLGIFTGTFIYSLLALRGVRTSPPFVPSLTLLGAVTLAVISIAALIYFIDHMAKEIQVNHLIAGTADDASRTIDVELPDRNGLDVPLPPLSADHAIVRAPRSGYLQLVDITGLLASASAHAARVDVVPKPGDFVSEGSIVARIEPASAADLLSRQCARAFDLGPTRTLQQDVAFGLRLIVDIGLKAISPAVNDPSTCSTCVDHLGALLRQLATRTAGALVIRDQDAIRVVVPRPSFKDLLDLAFNQLRQYGRGDLAVANRIVRALSGIAEKTPPGPRREAVLEQARLVIAGLDEKFLPEDRVELDAAYAAMRDR